MSEIGSGIFFTQTSSPEPASKFSKSEDFHETNSTKNQEVSDDEMEDGEEIVSNPGSTTSSNYIALGINHDLPLFVIHSEENLISINKWLVEKGGGHSYTTGDKSENRIGPIRIFRSPRQGPNSRETPYSLVMMDPSIYHNLIKNPDFITPPRVDKDSHNHLRLAPRKMPICRFSIAPYDFVPKRYPGNGQNNAIFVVLPPSLRRMECDEQIRIHLETAVEFELIPPNSFGVSIKPFSRERDNERDPRKRNDHADHRGFAFIGFDEDVSIERIIGVMELMHHTLWYKIDPKTKKPIATDYRFETNWSNDPNVPYEVKKEAHKRRQAFRRKKVQRNQGRSNNQSGTHYKAPNPGTPSEEFPTLAGAQLSNQPLLLEEPKKEPKKKEKKQKKPDHNEITPSVGRSPVTPPSTIQEVSGSNNNPMMGNSGLMNPMMMNPMMGNQMDPVQMQQMMMFNMMAMMNNMMQMNNQSSQSNQQNKNQSRNQKN